MGLRNLKYGCLRKLWYLKYKSDEKKRAFEEAIAESALGMWLLL
jgi:predicted thioredoxin/glutaredoxin